ncbi:hypothetical protein [Paludisphaera mucosa]|uniref:Uncharacterized protein n=1 Tax=Paludisphaera mucosa TaxID=3030827 RepID=A0ABT6F9M6_9BACT|nr:hypothetical protein [Paludisphaera mucosa]MDG3004217.1 hypothetical protein [Paludisphaera mucosa]
MASCDHCGSTILFGGVQQGFRRFCGEDCAHEAYWGPKLQAIPETEIDERLSREHQGACPKCGGPGPVDIHASHWIYSAVLFSRYGSRSELCCRSCARRNQAKDGAFSLVLGWWGFPFGIMITPAQLLRNFGGLTGLSGPKPDRPSPELRKLIAVRMAAERRDAPPGRAE